MTIHQKVFAIFASIVIFIVIINLVKKNKLKEEYSWLWLLTGFVMIILVLWYDLLLMITRLIGAVQPTTTVFIFAILFLICVALHFAIKISILTDQVKNLSQKISLLDAEGYNNSLINHSPDSHNRQPQ
jgi:hypothetical protein